MRIYLLRSRTPDQWFSPKEILDRFAVAYSDVESDINEPEPLGTMIVDSYRQSSHDGTHDMARQWGCDPPPVGDVEQQWASALLVHVTVERSDGDGFSAVLSNTASFELSFSDSTSTARRREIAYHVAHLLGYDVLIEDQFNEFDGDRLGEPVVVEMATQQSWWRIW